MMLIHDHSLNINCKLEFAAEVLTELHQGSSDNNWEKKIKGTPSKSI